MNAERLSCFATVTDESRDATKPLTTAPTCTALTARSLFKKLHFSRSPANYSSSNDKDGRDRSLLSSVQLGG